MTTFENTKIATGGLMRCCTATISTMYEKEPKREMVEDERIKCMYENKVTMKYSNGIISWVGYNEAMEIERQNGKS